jgi:hypothetical protein
VIDHGGGIKFNHERGSAESSGSALKAATGKPGWPEYKDKRGIFEFCFGGIDLLLRSLLANQGLLDLIRKPAMPAMPTPRRNIVAGSGTGAGFEIRP